MSVNINELEDINAIIDICIDRELYERILDKSILQFGDDANALLERLDKGLTSNDKWYNSVAQNVVHEMHEVLKKDDFPTRSISFDSQVDWLPKVKFDFKNEELARQENENWFFRKWSRLYWIKAIRAVLQKKNREPWISGFDDVVALLEASLPRINPTQKALVQTVQDQKKTIFAFLMELSATSRDEASHGYAERARNLVEDIGEVTTEQRDEYGSRYDRWIWYNMGLSYQHSRLNHEAVLEFNRVVSKFWKYAKQSDRQRDTLEFMFVVYPSILQRASICLQLQLGYHALQTLDFELHNCTDKTEIWVKKLRSAKNHFVDDAVSNLMKQRDIFQLEALLQLERLHAPNDEAAAFNDKLTKLLKEAFPEAEPVVQEWTDKQTGLPLFDETLPKRSGSQVKIIEQAVAWFLEELRDLGKKIKLYSNEELPTANREALLEALLKDIEIGIERSIKRIETVGGEYWNWAEGNSFDVLVYISKWGLFLETLGDILSGLKDKEDANLMQHIKTLIVPVVKFYDCRRKWIPVVRRVRYEEGHSASLALVSFRSDDLPDLVAGLRSFYKIMAEILVHESWDDDIRSLVIGYYGSYDDAMEALRTVHLHFLDALDEYEKEFSESRQITFLDRCNDRLIWVGKQEVSEKGCQRCLSQGNLQSGIPSYAITDPPHQQNWQLSPDGFEGLLVCPNVGNDSTLYKDQLSRNNYQAIMRNAELDFKQYFKDVSAHRPLEQAYHFLGLQRWNSLTPAQGKSVGGGYFIYRTANDGRIDLGIAIDPGFDFVRNFLRMGFSLVDIDLVLISHAHADHLWDFESIVQLLHEMSSKVKKMHRIDVVLTLGIYRRFKHVINNSTLRKHINPLVIDIRKEVDPDFLNLPFRFRKLDDNETRGPRWNVLLPGIANTSSKIDAELEIRATRAYHEDYSEESDSFGFILNLKANGREVSFGYTGDTKWVGNDLYFDGCPFKNGKNNECLYSSMCSGGVVESVAAQYKECDVILTHIGSLIQHKRDKEFKHYSTSGECESLIRKENHPYLFGMIRLLRELRSDPRSDGKLILLGEFGEELRGGIRYDIVDRLRRSILHEWPILPVDVGLDILLKKKSNNKSQTESGLEHKALCVICEQYYPINEIGFHRFGHDEALFYLCETCLKSTPEDVRDAKLRHIYDVGWELKHSI